MSDRRKFATIRAARRVWAVSAIHGEAERLATLHEALERRWERGDRIVYLGNFMGYGPRVRDTLDHMVAFRRMVMAREHGGACDAVFLRGTQEEMWNKLLQVQFAPDPAPVLRWMLGHGLDATLESYGGHGEAGFRAAREGALALTRWTGELRAAIQRVPGHAQLMSAVRRAAFTAGGELLFVHAGIDPARTLAAQGDNLWWGSAKFAAMDRPYGGYRKVIRGWDPEHRGLTTTAHTATIDEGCGFGGRLMAAAFDLEGEVADEVAV
jgi:serine/threonine protein phosphatase 1